MGKTVLGVIGGSGFYQMKGLTAVEQVELTTPFGRPSDPFFRGKLGECDVVFLSRHGRGHRLMPSELNFRANIYGMKQLGVDHLVSVSTAGSLKEELRPGDLVVPDQFIDHTYKRPASFFGDGIVAHVSLADPVCAALEGELFESAGEGGATVHRGGVYLCIEGPQFSTRAESNLYRRWGADVISMTAMQEARLAREAEMCYAALVLVTDYDCWHESVAAVDIGEILRVMRLNVERAQGAVAILARRIAARARTCACPNALRDAIITDRAVIPPKVAADLRPLIGKYLQ
jgi:5'-methylthioadenosine phosphorylase